jgi:hypothetical protein
MNGTQTSFIESLSEAARENPLSAALIGGGALWLLMGNEKLKRAASAAAPLADIGARNLRPTTSKSEDYSATQRVREMEASRRTNETLHETKNAASNIVSAATEAIKDGGNEVTQVWENLSKSANSLPVKKTFTKAQSTLSNVLERQPLALGLVGLAIGVTVAGAFGASNLEKEWVGELSDSIKTDLNTPAG